MEVGSADFPNAHSAMNAPLAKALYGIDGITRVYFGSDFITVRKAEYAPWDILKPEISAAIMDFYSSGKPLFLDANTATSMDTAINESSCSSGESWAQAEISLSVVWLVCKNIGRCVFMLEHNFQRSSIDPGSEHAIECHRWSGNSCARAEITYPTAINM